MNRIFTDRPLTRTEITKRYCEKHRDKIRIYKRLYYQRKIEKERELSRIRNERYRIKYPGRVTENVRRWVERNPERATQAVRERHRKYWEENLAYRIKSRVRDRVWQALRKQGEFRKLKGLIGCSKEELKIYLEKQFKPGMSWENWGKDGWHIDHRRPLSSFDLSNEQQLKIVAHYTNLQPLWARENMSKNNKIYV